MRNTTKTVHRECELPQARWVESELPQARWVESAYYKKGGA